MELTPEKLIGETIGLLFVESISHDTQDAGGRKRIFMNCKCSCGRTRKVDSQNLRLGIALTCGHQKYHKDEKDSIYFDLVGKKFGKLTVIEYKGEETIKYKSATSKNKLWLCKCDCGNEKIAKNNPLVCGKLISCGCRLKEIYSNIGIKRKSLEKGESAWNVYYSKYKYNAKKRDRIFELTFDEFKNLCSQNCIYCGIKPNRMEPSGVKERTVNGTVLVNGIDRVDNDVHYILSNCVTCCSQCNAAKKDFTEEQWNVWLDRILKFREDTLNS